MRLGLEVEDAVTGFRGLAISRGDYLNGCERILVQPQSLQADGSPVESQWFDSMQLRVIGQGMGHDGKSLPAHTNIPGGPARNDPPKDF